MHTIADPSSAADDAGTIAPLLTIRRPRWQWVTAAVAGWAMIVTGVSVAAADFLAGRDVVAYSTLILALELCAFGAVGVVVAGRLRRFRIDGYRGRLVVSRGQRSPVTVWADDIDYVSAPPHSQLDGVRTAGLVGIGRRGVLLFAVPTAYEDSGALVEWLRVNRPGVIGAGSKLRQ